jgi:putative DNA primase/helicase
MTKKQDIMKEIEVDTTILDEMKTAEEIIILTDFIKEKTRSTYKLAEYLTRKFSIITVGEKEREMYVYKDGMYIPAENLVIFPEIQRILGEHTTKNAKTETLHKIADMTSHPRSVFSSAPLNLIPLANGVYNIETKTLLPHSPEYRFMYQLPVRFDPDADCPLTKAFMEQIFSPDQLLSVQEWLGYYFYRQYIFKKAIIFVGEGDTGKTTFLEVITHLLGRDNLSAISLQKMTSDKFAAAHLYNKHGNLVDELSAKDISDTGNFKMATGGGSITGEYKFGNQFSFLNFSKFTFACNKIPDVKDFDDEAYFNRWMVMRFEKTIEKKIPNFIATLTTEEERSGLFNFAMQGLERLLKQGEFSYASSAIDTKLEMMRSGSSIAMFAAEGVTHDEGAEMSKADLYDAYGKFCTKRNLARETMDMFGKKLRFYIGYVLEGLIYDRENPKGKRVRGWRNISIVKDKDALSVDEEFDAI